MLNPESSTGDLRGILIYSLTGTLFAAIGGFFVTFATAVYAWLFRSYHNPCELAAIAGGITAIVCMPTFIIVTLPIGIAGGWLAAQQFMRTRLARPMVLFSKLRDEQWLEKHNRI